MSAPRNPAVAVFFVLALALASTGVQPEAAPVTYALVVDEVRDLGLLYGYLTSEAHAINETGAIAGSGENPSGTRRAMFWATPSSSPINLGHLGGGWSEAWGINDSAVVVGNSRASQAEESRGFRWSYGTGMTDVGLVGLTIGGISPVEFMRASDINNNGVIVGDLGNSFGTSGFFRSGLSVVLVPSCPDGGLLTATVKAINDNNLFTGNVFCQGGPWGAPYVASLSTTTLLPGDHSGSDSGYAVNSKGVVAGSWSGRWLHAFRWSPTTGFTDIHPTDDTTYDSVARGINKHGLIVGRKYTDTSNHAFVYSPGLQMKTLPGLCTWGSWSSASEAYAVNDSGWVVGRSKTCSGQYHATLWKVRIVVHGSLDLSAMN